MDVREHLSGEPAPCGRSVEVDHVRDDDEEGMVIDHLYYACGCRKSFHQFHDGSIQVKVIDHHGKLLTDEHSSMHEA